MNYTTSPWEDYFDAVVELAELRVKHAQEQHEACVAFAADCPEAQTDGSRRNLEQAMAELKRAVALRGLAAVCPDSISING